MNKIKYLIIIFLAGIIPMNYSVIEAQQNENIVNGFIESLELADNQINISVIDNLVKGASGQAVQNLNILMNYPEELGLDNHSLSP